MDDLIRHPTDQPTLGILLCKSKNKTIVEYALRDMSKPFGIAEYRLAEALPDTLQSSLPTIAALEAELQGNNVLGHPATD
ncbi:MAG: PDDEXK nuclease domain-containing protein [Janthinobacterium lividum]